MIKLQADENKIYARYANEEFVRGKNIYLPDNADLTQWHQFNSEDEAKICLGIPIEVTNEEVEVI